MASNSVRPVAPPALPLAPDRYDRIYFNLLLTSLRGFFIALTNAVNAALAGVTTDAIAVQQSGNTLSLGALTNFNINVVQLSANITTIVFPVTVSDGQLLTIRFQQTNGGGGPFIVVGWPTNVLIAGGGYVMSPALGAYDLLTFHYDLDSDLWFEQSRSQNM